ncbi:MAG: peptidoglycan DD-metalloendopeptidase family protein [Bacteroidetes bacterium]|nr:peptidoglycan DD-metalloendopeptidase family protein [Bacteroidota bacterium]MBU1114702.1 peptidoglycan DD-metalloendopeptidase family protein [Bacteroidota bacterium]MBU1798904.1 peptidoglycan DD-metalloendopeptidase family protein [Bacteroidota bacterium]
MNYLQTKLSLIALSLLALLLFSCSNEVKKEKVEPPKPNIYGLYVDSLNIYEGVVKKNETLTDILLPHNVSYKTISEIANLAKDKFNVRKINSGNEYKIFSKNDSTEEIQYFIYESDPINYAIVDFTDSINTVITGEKEVTIKERSVSGIIENSLYLTLNSQNVSDLLALKMADVFAWQIDFYRLYDGDSFKVIFEEKYIDNKFVGIGKIKSAYFNNGGEYFYAFYYKQKENGEYFDENGKSLRKAFLKSPLKFGRMSSSYSKNRFHPVLHRFKAHLGTDYAAPTGTPIHSTGDGVVIEAKYKSNNGNYVKIRHNGTYMTQYLHMSKIAKGIRPGVSVKQDQVIGYVGSTGLATGPHVCYRFWKNGEQVNSRTQKVVSSNPITEKNFTKYKLYVDSVKTIMDSIKIIKSNSLKNGVTVK